LTLSGKIGLALICLFAIPFAGFGLFALSQAIQLIGAGPGSPPVWFPLIFGVVFCFVGFGLIWLVFAGSKRMALDQRVKIEHPTEPWLWRKDWAEGRVKSNTRSTMWAGWIFAAFWNVVSIPIAILVVPAAAKQIGWRALLALIFPVAGVFLLIRAIRQTIAFVEFGKTYFQMASVPGVIGRDLKGVIQARFPHSPDHGIHLRLSSVHRVTTNTGNSTSTTETILWRDETDLSSGQLAAGPTGTAIPVDFRIPLDAQPTENLSFRDEFVWILEALADVPGVDYHDIFEIPVFRTQQTPTGPEAEKLDTPFTSVHAVARPEALTVQVRQGVNGTEFYFPAGRNKTFAVSTTVFLLIFGSITLFLLHARILIILPLAFGFFTLILGYITAQLWMGTSRIVFSPSEVSIQSGLLGGGKTQRFPLAEISSITDKIRAQQGAATGTPYYDIERTLRNGNKVTLGQTLRNKHETDWLVQEMRRLAGLARTASASTASTQYS
jgi:hypothetical protein